MKKLIHLLILWALPIYAVFSLTSMAGMNIGFVFILAAVVCGFAVYREAPLRSPNANLLAAVKGYKLWGWILFAACVFSLFCAQIFPYAYAGHNPEVTWHGYQKIWYLICPYLILTAFRYSLAADPIRGEVRFEKTVRAWWITIFFLLAMGINQFFNGWPFPQGIPTNPGYYHAILLMGHHLSVSSIVIFPAFTALAIAFGTFTRTRKIPALEASVGLAGLIILFLTYARTTWLAIPIGIILLFARYLNPKKLLASAIVLIVALAALSQTSFLKERIQNGMGIQERMNLWIASIDYFKHRPITGIGWLKNAEMSEFYFKENHPETYHQYFWGHSHSNFFEMLGGTGIIGLLAFFGWSFFTLKLSYQTSMRARNAGELRWSDFSWGIFVALLLLHFNGLTNVTFWEGKVMHQQMLAVGMLLILQVFVSQKANAQNTPSSGN
jgi:O-antigen ligase